MAKKERAAKATADQRRPKAQANPHTGRRPKGRGGTAARTAGKGKVVQMDLFRPAKGAPDAGGKAAASGPDAAEAPASDPVPSPPVGAAVARAAAPARRRETAESLGRRQREISVAEFFQKNRHLLGFDNPAKALLTATKEAVDNSLDACEEAGILPALEIVI